MAKRGWSPDKVFLCKWCGTYQRKVDGQKRQYCPKCDDFTVLVSPLTPQQIGGRKTATDRKERTRALSRLCVQRYVREDMTLPTAACMVRMLYEDSKDVLSKSILTKYLHELGYEPFTGETRAGNGWRLKRVDENGE